jgi:hypothetical protein
MPTPYEELDRILFIKFCEAVRSSSKGRDRVTFLKDLSEQLCRQFDLPIYIPSPECKHGKIADFYKADIGKIVNELWMEDFDVDEALSSYLISDDRFPDLIG